MKRFFKRICIFFEKWLFAKDLFTVFLFMAVVWFGMNVTTMLFGEVLAPPASMAYIIKALTAINTFAILLAGSWILLRIFLAPIAKYFIDPEANDPNLNSTFIRDLRDIRKYNNSKCYKRAVFYLSVYLVWLLAMIITATAIF